MADFDKINIDAVPYNVKDSTARQQISNETNAREQADSQLSQQIENVSNSLADETTDREQAVTQLQQAIDTEKTDREQADAELENKITQAAERMIPATPEQFGAVGDGETDDTAAFNAMFASGIGFYVCGRGKNYKISGNVACSTDCTLDLNGSTIYLTQHAIQTDAVRNFQFTASKVEIYNGTVDGNSSDQWNTDISNMMACYAFNISASIVSVRDMSFQNIWGYALRIENAVLVSVSESSFVNVGGHYHTNNEYDMFGDAIYIGTASARQNVNIKGCQLFGKASGSTLSRAGIVLEYGDQDRNLVVENTTIENYDRALHTEEVGEVKVSFTGCHFYNVNVVAFWWNDGTSDGNSNKLIFTNCYIFTTGNDYSGTRGIRGFKFITFLNSIINYAGSLIWSMSGSQYDLLLFQNCSVLGNVRGNADSAPLIQTAPVGKLIMINTWYEAVTGALAHFIPAGVKTIQIGGTMAAGNYGWGSAISNYYIIEGEISGITGYHIASFS